MQNWVIIELSKGNEKWEPISIHPRKSEARASKAFRVSTKLIGTFYKIISCQIVYPVVKANN